MIHPQAQMDTRRKLLFPLLAAAGEPEVMWFFSQHPSQ